MYFLIFLSTMYFLIKSCMCLPFLFMRCSSGSVLFPFCHAHNPFCVPSVAVPSSSSSKTLFFWFFKSLSINPSSWVFQVYLCHCVPCTSISLTLFWFFKSLLVLIIFCTEYFFLKNENGSIVLREDSSR